MLEPGEIYDLISDIELFDVQIETTLKVINKISRDIDEILTHNPENVFEFCSSAWIQDLKGSVDELAPYWTHVTYFSLNSSGSESKVNDGKFKDDIESSNSKKWWKFWD